MSQSSSVPEHPFVSYLVALLSIYELESNPNAPTIPLPSYEGPRDFKTDIIERSLAKIVHRMHIAEEKLGTIHPRILRRDFEDDTEPDNKQFNPTSTARRPSQDVVVDPFDLAPQVSQLKEHKSVNPPNPMQIPLESVQHDSDPTIFHPLRSPGGSSQPSPGESPLVVPPGPLSSAAFESRMTAIDELRLLKAQVSDIARVCNAVAHGDLTHRITVPVQGPLMVQLKDVVNTMVDKLEQFAKELTRVPLKFESEGYCTRTLGEQTLEGVQGT